MEEANKNNNELNNESLQLKSILSNIYTRDSSDSYFDN